MPEVGPFLDGLQDLTRRLGLMGNAIVDVSSALISANVNAGPQGEPKLLEALNAAHSIADDVLAAQRTVMSMLEYVRVAATTNPEEV
jgi:hypothetical protein